MNDDTPLSERLPYITNFRGKRLIVKVWYWYPVPKNPRLRLVQCIVVGGDPETIALQGWLLFMFARDLHIGAS